MKIYAFIAMVAIAFILIPSNTQAMPNPAATYCTEMGYTLESNETGTYCIFGDGNLCEEFSFYKGECGAEYVKDVECAKAGEQSGIAVKCCEGLESISTSRPGSDGVCMDVIGGYPICSDCGNGICEEWENECNCPKDCSTDSIHCTSASLIGDANGDGKVTPGDVKLIEDVYFERLPMPDNICCIDLNNDGKVTQEDALYANDIYLGKKESPGYCNYLTSGTGVYNENQNQQEENQENQKGYSSCTMPICENGSNPMFTEKYNEYKCPVYKCKSEKYYSHASWVCYDGTGTENMISSSTSSDETGIKGSSNTDNLIIKSVPGTEIEISITCKSASEWKEESERFCKGHCSEETGKCGVNTFSVWDECIHPKDTCSDSDGGKNYYKRGKVKTGSGITEEDSCTYCTGFCEPGEECNSVCRAVEEFFCGENGIEKTIYSCPNGCKDGECLAVPTSACTSDSDCGVPEKDTYCADGSACMKTKYPKCINPGTERAKCSYVATGGCKACPNGCEDGKCIDSKCGDGICEENEKCDIDCCSYYCQLSCPNGYIEGSCHCECKEDNGAACIDSDDGLSYYVSGIAKGTDGSFFADICDVDGKTLQEGICTSDGKVASEKYRCPVACENGKCVESIENACSGCKENGKCLPIGFRKDGAYCDADKEMKTQKGGNLPCDNNHECKSNVCVNSKCVSPSLIDTIISWFQRFFGV
ncbi:MAG: DUF333 domain-containing protein [Candidatus Micrarchaeota archaeon]|nr:DUF333 domain-containing protein [Candidatus Micrarchaeota archaeon]